MIEEFRVGDVVEWDSPDGYHVEKENGIVTSHGTIYKTRQGMVVSVYDPAEERKRLLALHAEGKGFPLYGDWYNLKYVVKSENQEYCPHPITHRMRLVTRATILPDRT